MGWYRNHIILSQQNYNSRYFAVMITSELFLFSVEEQAIFQRNLAQLFKKHPEFPQVRYTPINMFSFDKLYRYV